MAVEARYTEQFPFVGTPTHRSKIEEEAKRRRKSRATVIRYALDQYFNLVDGEVPHEGVSEE